MHRGLSAAAELGHVLVSPWIWEVSVNIPCPLMVFLRCFLLLPSCVPVHPAGFLPVRFPSCLTCQTPSMAAETLAAQTSLLPVPVSVQAAACDASSDLAGGPEMWPSPKAHCVQAGTDPSHVSFPAAVSCQPCQGQLGEMSQAELRLTFHPHLQTMSQCAHAIRLLPADPSGW